MASGPFACSARQDDQVARQVQGPFDAFRHDIEDRSVHRAEDPFGQGGQRLQAKLVLAIRPGHPRQIVQRALSQIGALSGRHDGRSVPHQRARQPDDANRDHGKRRPRKQHTAQPPRARGRRLDGMPHGTQGCDHLGIGEFKTFAGVEARREDRRLFALVDPLDGRQRPVADRRATFGVGQDQGRVAKAHKHLAALILRRFTPQATAFQPLILLQRRHRPEGLCLFCASLPGPAGDDNHPSRNPVTRPSARRCIRDPVLPSCVAFGPAATGQARH